MAAISMTCSAAGPGLSYPKAPTSNTVDNYFGKEVADPYRPLENDTASETLEWVKAENKVTQNYLSQIPFRDDIRRRITEANNYRKSGMPWRGKDGKFYFYENDGLRNQSVLYRMDSIGGTPEVFLDPNTLSDNGTVALTGISMSKDGKYTAYTISRKGSDWTEIYVMDTKTRQLLPDHIEWAKFTGAAWHGDGFYYSAYPSPEAGKEFSNANENHRIYYHKLGTPQSEDVIVFEDKANPLHFHHATVAGDETVLFVSVGGQGVGDGLMMKKLDDPSAQWIVIEPSQDYDVTPVKVKDGKIYYLSSKDAPLRRLMVAPVDNPTAMEVFIPESDAPLTDVNFTQDKIIVSYERDASTHSYVYSLDGKQEREIKFPTYGTAGFITSDKYPEVFYTFTSYVYPSTGFAYDMATGESTIMKTPEIKNFKSEDYVTEQVFYPSADGTKIPMFLTYKKGLKRDGKNPVYLYGYGGFNVSLTPSFSSNRLIWLENGGIFAVANLRGGS